MPDEQDSSDDVIHTYYGFRDKREPADGEDEPAANCLEYGGSGKALLLISAKPCKACGGSGKVAAAANAGLPPPEVSWESGEGFESVVIREAGCWISVTAYDAQGRIRTITESFVPDDPGPDAGKAPKVP